MSVAKADLVRTLAGWSMVVQKLFLRVKPDCPARRHSVIIPNGHAGLDDSDRGIEVHQLSPMAMMSMSTTKPTNKAIATSVLIWISRFSIY
jgi:hypothetical protein